MLLLLVRSYACRNGHLSIVKTLIEDYDANVHLQAKAGVTAFQFAVWQNHMNICTYLTSTNININGDADAAQFCYPKIPVIPKKEINDFGCGIIHWLGIIPTKRSDNILAMARWIIEDHDIDVYSKQSMGHTVLHKAAWGGHLNLVQYLHEKHGMYDDLKDHAGNYAADLCDMANTDRHSIIALYLRKECSPEYKESCRILGIDIEKNKNKDLSEDVIRRAYLDKARVCHPDRRTGNENGNGDDEGFQLVKWAYEHLMSGGIATKQNNPAHSIHLLLECKQGQGSTSDIDGNGNGNGNGNGKSYKDKNNEDENEGIKGIQNDELKLFKTRLMAVLLEYGDKGLDLSNIPKKWNQVWPDVKLPTLEQKKNGRRKKGQLLHFIKEHAGDVVKVSRQKQNGQVSVIISPRDMSSYIKKFPWVASNSTK